MEYVCPNCGEITSRPRVCDNCGFEVNDFEAEFPTPENVIKNFEPYRYF